MVPFEIVCSIDFLTLSFTNGSSRTQLLSKRIYDNTLRGIRLLYSFLSGSTFLFIFKFQAVKDEISAASFSKNILLSFSFAIVFNFHKAHKLKNIAVDNPKTRVDCIFHTFHGSPLSPNSAYGFEEGLK